ncbi:MAG: DUF2442 domain-containing protein [Deltaproteobacteria bacterium]|nr:DUF2442 domain-containing protein [Deltaproteobacteria bacterium]MBI4925292.1 DUF2442 domain-containing protein [Bdellovibrio sp.]
MNTFTLEERSRFISFWIDSDFLFLKLPSGKVFKRHKSVSKRLKNASKSKLAKFEILGDGEGVYWPLLDEDLSAAFLIYPEKFTASIKKSG